MGRFALRLTVSVACMLFGVTAHASPILVVDTNGILTGATGVLVDGELYDVEFVDGTCASVFGVCDEAHFAFTTESTALAASKALLDEVLLDVPGFGDFDSNPMLTNGCSVPGNCWILTPYAIMDSNFLITQTYNQPDPNQPDGYFVHTPNGPGVPISNYDGSTDSNGVLAKWTAVPQAVPEPASGILVGAGLAIAFGWARRTIVTRRFRRL